MYITFEIIIKWSTDFREQGFTKLKEYYIEKSREHTTQGALWPESQEFKLYQEITEKRWDTDNSCQ